MIDRSGCNAYRHGNYVAYQKWQCKCEDARADVRQRTKAWRYRRQRFGVQVDKYPIFMAERRLHALMRIGWPAVEVMRRAGRAHTAHRPGRGDLLRQKNVAADTLRRIDKVYQELCMTPGPSNRSRLYAEKMGWPAPLDWDNIDDPDEIPANKIEYSPAETLAAKDYVTDKLTRAEVLLLTPEQMAERRKYQLQRHDKKKRERAA